MISVFPLVATQAKSGPPWEFFVLAAAGVASQVWLARRRLRRWSAEWAAEQEVTIERLVPAMTGRTPWSWRTNRRWQCTFRVAVREASGARREGWMRMNLFAYPGSAPDIEVVWDSAIASGA